MRKVTAVAFVCLLILIAVPTLSAAAGFSVETNKAVNVPDRTVPYNGQTFDIEKITKVDPNEDFTVSVNAPESRFFSDLYDKNRVSHPIGKGTGSKDFDPISLKDTRFSQTGTYAIVVASGGVTEAVHAVVVRGYSVEVDSLSSVTVGDSITVNGSFNYLERGDTYEKVEIVVAATNSNENITSVPNVDNGTFSASISTDDLSAGDYDVYAIVRGPEQALGEKEIIGFSDPKLLSVEPNNDSGDDTGGDDGTDGDTDDGDSDDGTGGNTDDGNSGTGGDGGGSSSDGTTSGDSGSGDANGGANTDDSSSKSGTDSTDPGGSTPADGTPEGQTPDIPEQASLNDGPVSRSIADSEPDQNGVSVPVNAGPVGQLTLDTTDTESGGEVTVSQPSATTEQFNSQYGADRVKTAVSITVPESLAETGATIELSLGETDLGDTAPADLRVIKGAGGGSQLLSSRVETTPDGRVVITARTPSFSEFAVVAAEPDPEPNVPATGNETETAGTDTTVITESSDGLETDSPEDATPGFGALTALVALVVVLVTARTRTD